MAYSFVVSFKRHRDDGHNINIEFNILFGELMKGKQQGNYKEKI